MNIKAYLNINVKGPSDSLPYRVNIIQNSHVDYYRVSDGNFIGRLEVGSWYYFNLNPSRYLPEGYKQLILGNISYRI